MSLTKLELKDFTAFGHVQLDLVNGVNVLLGENACGKTHAMKALYSGLRAHPSDGTTLRFTGRVEQKLVEVFRPAGDRVGHLARRIHGQSKGTVRVEAGEEWFRYTVSSKGSKVSSSVNKLVDAPTAIFLPSRELLAIYEGFIHAYSQRELAFDRTYYDACVALSGNPLRGVKAGIQQVIDDLHGVLGGRVQLDGPRFYVKSGAARLEAHLVAEGMRKIGAIVRLLQNGSLSEHGVLLWDEPEANLNPKLTVFVAEVLLSLAKHGVQVIVATHDYLLSETVGFMAPKKNVPVRFFGLHRKTPGGPVSATRADEPGLLDPNPIREEFLAHYDRLRDL